MADGLSIGNRLTKMKNGIFFLRFSLDIRPIS